MHNRNLQNYYNATEIIHPLIFSKFQSVDESEAVSSIVEFEIVSDWHPLSLSEDTYGLSSVGCFKNQYIMLAVRVRIIF